MKVSLFSFLSDVNGESVIDAYVQHLAAARDEGFRMVWVPQLAWEPDVVTVLAVAFREIEDLRIGTGVLPIQSRLAMVMAQQALTLNLLSEGRFSLGIGLTHPPVSEGMWGVPWDRPVRRLNEYLDGLLPLLSGSKADATGETATARGRLMISAASAPPVYVAALGPQLLRVAGRRTAGTITWMTGPKTLTNHVVPTIRSAAAEGTRDVEVVAGYPICVTDDGPALRALARERLEIYGRMPSYRAMLDREGLDGPGDLALIGDEEDVAGRFETIREAGADELAAMVFGRGAEDEARTRAFLRRYV